MLRRIPRALTRAFAGLTVMGSGAADAALAQDGPIEYMNVSYLSSFILGRKEKPGGTREPNALAVVASRFGAPEVRLLPHINDAPVREETGFHGSWPTPLKVTIEGARPIGDGYFALPVHDGPNTVRVRLQVPAARWGDRNTPAKTYTRSFTLHVVMFTLTPLSRLPDDGWRSGSHWTYGSDGIEATAQGDVFYIGKKPMSGALERVTLRRLTAAGREVTYQLSESGDGFYDGNAPALRSHEVRVLGADPAGRLYVDVMHSLVVFDAAGKYLGTLGTMYAGDRPWKPQTAAGKPTTTAPSKVALLPPYLANRPTNAKWGNTFLSTVWDPETKSFVSLVANVDSRRYATPARKEVREPGYFLVRVALDGRMTLLATLAEPMRSDVVIEERIPIFRDAQGRICVVTDKEILRWRGTLTREPRPAIPGTGRLLAFTQDGGLAGEGFYLSPDQQVYATLDLSRVQPLWDANWRDRRMYRDVITGREAANERPYEVGAKSVAPDPGWTADGRYAATYDDGYVALFGMAAYAASANDRGPVTEGPDFAKLDQERTTADPSVTVVPSTTGGRGAQGLIPADANFPATIEYARGVNAAGVPVRFSITSGRGAELRTSRSRGATVTAVTDEQGIARVRLHYVAAGETRLDAPVDYTVAVDEGGRTSRVVVRVGLGLTFDRASYIKGSYKLGTYPLPLSVKSAFYPGLDVGLYLFNAAQTPSWEGKTPGFQLFIEHQNTPSGNRGVAAHKGTGRLARVENATLLLTDGQPRYYMTNWELPAVEIRDPGTYVYRVNAKLCVLDASQRCVADNWAEGMIPPALITIVTEAPEAWYQSLACSFEAQDIVQYAMLETAKMMPVYGKAVDGFSTATSLTCKLIQGEYESAFYDLGTVLGGKYLDHLKEPAVYAKLTGKQQAALDLAKAAYDKLDEHAKSEQRKALIKASIEKWGMANPNAKTDTSRISELENVRMAPSAAAPAPGAAAAPAPPAAGASPPAEGAKRSQDARATFGSLRDRLKAAAKQVEAMAKTADAPAKAGDGSLRSWLTSTTFNWSDNGRVLGTMKFGSGGSATASWSGMAHGWTMDNSGVLVVSAGGRQYVTRLLYDAATRAFTGARDASSEVQDGVRVTLVPASR